MQDRNSHPALYWRLITAIVAITALNSGCAKRFYASRLPPDLIAPSILDLEAINLSGLTDQSVSAEVIQPGDVLEVTIINDFAKLTTTTTPVRVADDGTVVIPLVGRVSVGGLEIERAEQSVNAESITRACSAIPASR